LVEEIEKAFPDAKRFEAFTGQPSKRNLPFAGPRGLQGIQDRAVHAGHHVGLSAKGTPMSQEQIELITVDTLLDKVRAKHGQGCRLVQISATRLPGQVELTYSFDLDSRLPICACRWPAKRRTCRASVPSTAARFFTRMKSTICST
jgi:hypothetical protein